MTEPEVRAEAEVRLWGGTVGALVELADGRIIFEYADEFRGRGLEISPIHLPVSRRGPLSFAALRDAPAFEGLPGVLADALPDAFGRRVIRAYYAARGQDALAMSPVQRMLYVGERGIGALTFHPAADLPARPAEAEALDLQSLAEDAQRIVHGDPEVAVPEIYRIGSSAGGQRPKAIVHYDPDRRTIRSGGIPVESHEVPCILKFDGITEDATADALGAPQPFNRVEAAYADMARAAGIDMARIDVLEADGYAHLLVHRFDFSHGDRLHQHTLGGLLHVDYHDVGSSSYEEYFRTVLRLGMAYDALREAYRRMVFNIIAVNQDDHVKNFSFHMDQTGTWSLTPAYDVTFAHGHRFTATHQLRLRDKTADIRLSDLLAVADEFGIKKPEDVVDEVCATVANWDDYADKYNVPRRAATVIAKGQRIRANALTS